MSTEQTTKNLNLSQIEKLNYKSLSYVLWTRIVKPAIWVQSQLTRVAKYVFDNYDDYLDELEPLPGTSQLIRDQNAERRKEKRKFEVAEEIFIYQIESTISPSLIKEMENDEEYIDIRNRNDSRDYWLFIENFIKSKNKNEAIVANAFKSLERFRQLKGETFSEAAERFDIITNEIEFLGEKVSKAEAARKYLSGLEPYFNRLKERLQDKKELREMEISEIAITLR